MAMRRFSVSAHDHQRETIVGTNLATAASSACQRFLLSLLFLPHLFMHHLVLLAKKKLCSANQKGWQIQHTGTHMERVHNIGNRPFHQLQRIPCRIYRDDQRQSLSKRPHSLAGFNGIDRDRFFHRENHDERRKQGGDDGDEEIESG
jgi:hypothetical protein